LTFAIDVFLVEMKSNRQQSIRKSAAIMMPRFLACDLRAIEEFHRWSSPSHNDSREGSSFRSQLSSSLVTDIASAEQFRIPEKPR
jgi:hypothetical protein